MEQKTLKYLRVFIPGIIILLGLYPIYNEFYSELYKIDKFETTYVIFVAILFGGIYYQLNIRYLVTYISHKIITNNILNKLIKASGLSIDEDARKKLRKDDNYMTAFYDAIDTNESLKRKGENVRFNGIFWTSTADLFILSLIFYFIYAYCYNNIENIMMYKKVFLYIAGLSAILHVISVIKHIFLSNEQLKPIISDAKMSKTVKDKFNEYLS